MTELQPWQQNYVELTVTRVMSGLPRFGHSNEFAMIFGTAEQQNDYIVGLLFAGVFILSFFLLWTILIPIFMCLGRRKIGFLSGHAFQVPYGSKKPMICRTTFIVATITLVTFSSLLVTKGLTQVDNGINTVHDNAVEVNRILNDVQRFLDTAVETTEVAFSLRDATVPLLEDGKFCPGVDLSEVTGVGFDVDFDVIIPEVISSLNDLGNFSQDAIADLQRTVDELSNTADDIEETSNNIEVSDWQSLIFIIPFSIFSFVFIVGVLLAWFDKSFEWLTCFITWFVLPLFFILVTVCWVCAGAIAIGASANADFCAGGTDNTPASSITQILALNGFDEDDMLFRVAQFYIKQCINTPNPLAPLLKYQIDLSAAQAALSEFAQAMTNTTVESLVQICGQQDYYTIVDLVKELSVNSGELVDALLDVLANLSCPVIVPIYTSTFYNVTCQYSVKAVTWCFSAFLVISLMGLLMITFRSSLRPTVFEEEVKFFNSPTEYVEEHEVQYDEPNDTEQFHEAASWLEGEEDSYGVPVVTGVAAGAAADEAIHGEDESLADDNPVYENPVNEVATKSDEMTA